MATRVAFVGVGAIGGYIGGHITRAGEDVTLIDMWPEHVRYMREHGLQLSGVTPEETYSVPVNVLHMTDVQGLSKQKPIDIAFISVKSYDTQWATMLIKPYLAPDGFCVSLQNCINEEYIAEVVGWGKTLGTAVSGGLGAELYAPGHVKRTTPLCGTRVTPFRVGEVHGGITERAQEVARLLRHVDSARVSDNLWGERWAKLVINAMRNGLSAVTAMSGNDRDLNELTRWVSIRLGAEAVKIGQALGYKLTDMPYMDPDDLRRAGEGDKEALAVITKAFIDSTKSRTDEQRPSMAQDIFKGRRTETNYINGYVAAKGREAGIEAPVNAKIDALVQRVERGELKASIDNVKDI